MFREREAGVGVTRGAEVPVGIGGMVGISVACGAQAETAKMIKKPATRMVINDFICSSILKKTDYAIIQSSHHKGELTFMVHWGLP